MPGRRTVPFLVSTSQEHPMETSEQTNRLYRIVEDGMCIGCGICQAVAGPDLVRVAKAKSGWLHPHVLGEPDEATVDRIYDICPGTRLDGLPEREIDESTSVDMVWGHYRSMAHAWSARPAIRFEGSTGGVLTSLACHLLESGEVDFILHARASSTDPTFGERHLSFTEADVLEGVGSRYGPTAPLIDINRVLDRGQPFAFIGKPCDITALRNYARHDARVDRLVKYWLTFVCGGYVTPAGMDDFLARQGVAMDELTYFRYRGRGCPGPTTYETKDGRRVDSTFQELWGTSATSWPIPFRCKVCSDGIGDAADIAAADTWPEGGKTSGKHTDANDDDDPGRNAIIMRTRAGEALAQAAVASGWLTIADAVDPETMTFYLPHHRDKRHAVRARFAGLAAEGRTVPETHGLLLDELADHMGEPFNSLQTEGTRRRVREGKCAVPRPELAE